MGYKLTWVYIRPNGTEQKIRPNKREPTANTVLYLPLETDFLDYSTNEIAITNLGSVTLVNTGTWASIPVAQFNSSSMELTFTNPLDVNDAWTMSFWVNITSQNTNGQLMTAGSWSYHRLFQIWYIDNPSRWLTVSNYWEDVDVGSYVGRDGTRHLVTVTSSWVSWSTATINVYVDASLVKSWTNYGWNLQSSTFMIWNYNQEVSLDGYLSKVIIEDVERASADITDYYNLTKWDYWIS
jgi:hypothetical protein